MLKRFFSMLLVISMVFGLTACGGKTQVIEKNGSEAKDFIDFELSSFDLIQENEEYYYVANLKPKIADKYKGSAKLSTIVNLDYYNRSMERDSYTISYLPDKKIVQFKSKLTIYPYSYNIRIGLRETNDVAIATIQEPFDIKKAKNKIKDNKAYKEATERIAKMVCDEDTIKIVIEYILN